MPFRLRLVLPTELGPKIGSTATVLLSGGAGGTALVELKGAASLAGPWIYVSETLAFEPSQDWAVLFVQTVLEKLWRLQPGAFARTPPTTIRMNAPDGDLITASFGEARNFASIFDNPIALAAHRVRRQLDDHEILLRTAIIIGAVTPDHPAVSRRLVQIRNARTMMSFDGTGDPGSWPEHMPLAIGLQYLWLLNLADDRDWDTSPAKLPPNISGTSYQTTIERNAVEAMIASVREMDTVANYFKDLWDRMEAGIDPIKGMSHYIPFDDLMIAFKGEDWDGNKVDRFTQRLAQVRLALSAFVAVAGAHGVTKAAFARGALTRKAVTSLPSKFTEEGFARRFRWIYAQPYREKANLLPSSRVLQGEQTAAQRTTSLKAAYGTDAGFSIRETPLGIRHGVRQCAVDNACGVAAMTFVLDLKNVARIGIKSLATFLRNAGIKVADTGISPAVAKQTLQLYGAVTRWMDFSYEAIEQGLKKGKVYFVNIKLKNAKDGHAVVLTGVKRTGGKIYAVEFFDWNARGIVTMSRVPFEKLGCAPGSMILEVGFKPG
ncbi:MAG: hypothetical protein C3F17_10085 [Bradyrhizobiaceae bacterium]|nr:MAG: hypothetical protein C3F17_10085 [Bradyrhizobiaceae bacterium]